MLEEDSSCGLHAPVGCGEAKATPRDEKGMIHSSIPVVAWILCGVWGSCLAWFQHGCCMDTVGTWVAYPASCSMAAAWVQMGAWCLPNSVVVWLLHGECGAWGTSPPQLWYMVDRA